jgi:uncharacterized membrane protein YsdA (DUF1294 family)
MTSYGLMAIGATATLALITRLDLWVCWLVGVNTTVLIAFSLDKSAAMRNRWRIPEVVLHTLAAAGGSPMAWLGRVLFNHKSRKVGFGRTLGTITGIQVVLIAVGAYVLSQT